MKQEEFFEGNPMAEMLISSAKNLKKTIMRKILPFIILATIGSFLIGFILGAIIF